MIGYLYNMIGYYNLLASTFNIFALVGFWNPNRGLDYPYRHDNTKLYFMKGTFTRIAASVYASLFVSASLLAQTATINLSDEKQYIRGFGGMNHPTWTGYDLTDAQRNLVFGNGDGQLGFSILRIWVDSNKNNWYKELATAKRVQELDGIVFATPWNPPTDMVETVSRNNRSEKRLKYSSYAAYAQHLKDYNNYMKENGVNLYAMSFANEPDYGYDWTWYSADEVYNFTKNYASSLRINGTKVISAESFAYNKSYYDKILDDASTLANIDIIGTHFYASDANTNVSFFQYAKADQKAASKERWMTEHYTSSEASTTSQVRADLWPEALDVSYEIYRAMVEGNFSAYVWWYIRRDYGPIRQSDGAVTKRGYLMAQYAKFVRPGFVRVDADKNPTYNVYVSAFKKENDVVIVAVNRSTETKTLTFSIPGTKVTKWDEYVTSGTKNLKKENSINAANGSFQITLDAQSTTTFVGTAPSGIPTVELTAPATDSNFESPADIELSATATDTDGKISKVEFFNGETKIGEATSAPFLFTWKAVEEGFYSITAVATDNDGNTAVSSASLVNVHVPQAPYNGSPSQIPGKIETEDYDLGGEGIAYHDNDTENKGDTYRTDGVDITGDDTEGYKLGWTIAGEWLEYTVNVQKAGIYEWSANVSASGDGAAFHLLLDDQEITEKVEVPNTGDWNTYSIIKGNTTELTEGEHILKLAIDGNYFNIDWIQFSNGEPSYLVNITSGNEIPAGNYVMLNLLGENKGYIQLTDNNNWSDITNRKYTNKEVYILRSLDNNKSYIINPTR